MARGINKVILIGNLGSDPNFASTSSGVNVVTISLATTKQWKDKETAKAMERTEWHRVVFFNNLADIAKKYLKKGSKIYLEGELRTRKWEDQEGITRYTTEVIVRHFEMLDKNLNDNSHSGHELSEEQVPEDYDNDVVLKRKEDAWNI